MIDFKYELEEMISTRNLMNSYKLYFLKAVIINASNDNKELGFYELACWMCAYSFADVCSLGCRIRPLDRLYDVVALAIEKEELMESSKITEIYDAISNTNNRKLRKLIMSLCDYVPYRLLAYIWPQELRGKTDRQKNQIIEELSQSEERCIYSISQEQKVIEVNSEWLFFISRNRKILMSWLDQKIDSFIRKDKK